MTEVLQTETQTMNMAVPPAPDHQLHFVLFPFMAQGHMIPMLDIARLLAHRGVVVTVVLTPLNNSRFKLITDRAIQSGLPIRLLQLHFPTLQVGLPQGCEILDTVPSPDLGSNFLLATSMLQHPFEQSLSQMNPTPSCIISDFCLPWTSDTANKFEVPRIIFHGMGCFSLLCSHNILRSKILDNINSQDPFVIPGLPDCIEITEQCLPEVTRKSTNDHLAGFQKRMEEAEAAAYGVIVNSFSGLEPDYVQEYQKTKQNKVWCVGPVSLYNDNVLDKFERGNKASIDENHCLKWLDSKQKGSVVYVCLGTLCRLIPEQFMEIGLGLEAAEISFIWVIKEGERYEELDTWLSGFQERIKDRGLVIKGWAPQVLILSHQAIGGFLTHCGWNSTLEGVSAGVPMITWPMFAEQFLNEKLLVQVLGIGIQVGVCEPVHWGKEESVGVLVKREDVKKAVGKLMEKDDEGEERRRKIKGLAEMARKAMKEGGSSHLSMTLLIQDIEQEVSRKRSYRNV